MSNRIDEWSSLWRSSAYEAVPYTDDFPECLLTLPELIDGAVAQGAATQVKIRVELNKPGTGVSTLIVEDNGIGISSEKRLLTWASPKNGEGASAIHHRYGHGSKKNVSKWAPDYSKAVWMVQYRRKDLRGASSCLHTISAPFRGRDDTSQFEDENDAITLFPSGTRWTCDFESSILGRCQNPDVLYSSIKEILRTRYSEEYFAKTEFIIEVADAGEERHRGNSKIEGWKTFQQCLEDECRAKNAVLCYDEKVPFNSGHMSFKYYQITADGRGSYLLRDEFPILGQKNMKCSRIHIALNGRYIEARPIYKFHDTEANHNRFNGFYGFVSFEANPSDIEQLPTPCTTKVSFYENCPRFTQFLMIMDTILKKPYIQKPSPLPVPSPSPLLSPPSPHPSPHPKPLVNEPTPLVNEPMPSVNLPKPPTPLPTQPKITFDTKKKSINVLEGTKIVYKIPYVGDDDAWIEVFTEVIKSKGIVAFKQWCAKLVEINKTL
jgi:hypothetical protein